MEFTEEQIDILRESLQRQINYIYYEKMYGSGNVIPSMHKHYTLELKKAQELLALFDQREGESENEGENS